jgi:hypothetical protein
MEGVDGLKIVLLGEDLANARFPEAFLHTPAAVAERDAYKSFSRFSRADHSVFKAERPIGPFSESRPDSGSYH